MIFENQEALLDEIAKEKPSLEFLKHFTEHGCSRTRRIAGSSTSTAATGEVSNLLLSN